MILRFKAAFFGGLLVCFALAAFHSPAGAQDSYLGVKSDSSPDDWKLTDCHTPWEAAATAATTLRANCNLRIKNDNTRYAYPKIEWRSFGPKAVMSVFEQWKTDYTSTFHNLRTAVLTAAADSKKQWTPKIIYSGDASAIKIFGSVMAVSTAAAIGGITVNAQNKRRLQIHTRKANIIGTPPVIWALYDQYNGRLFLHAFKSRRSSAKHVEVLRTRLSPLHLGFLHGGKHKQNPFRRFYKAEEPYRFDGVDFAGAITAAGQLAQHLGAAQVIISSPLVDFEILRGERKYDPNINYVDFSIFTHATLKPRWFYGIPQANGSSQNIGFTGAICATTAPSIKISDCDEDGLIPSYLTVMKVSRFSIAGIAGGAMEKEALLELNMTTDLLKYKLPEFLAFPDGDIAADAAMVTGNKRMDVFSMLKKIHANHILLEDFSAAKDFFTAAAYARVSINNTLTAIISNGALASKYSFGATAYLKSLNRSVDITPHVIGEIINKPNIATMRWKSLKRLYQGECADDEKRTDCDDDKPAGIVPRADDFIPYAGGDIVVPLFSTEEWIKALKEARKK